MQPHAWVRLQGTFSARFKAPDVYGVFKLRVAHRRLGYTPIEIEQQVLVPFPETTLSVAVQHHAAAEMEAPGGRFLDWILMFGRMS